MGAAPAQSSVLVQPSAGGSEVFALTQQYGRVRVRVRVRARVRVRVGVRVGVWVRVRIRVRVKYMNCLLVC